MSAIQWYLWALLAASVLLVVYFLRNSFVCQTRIAAIDRGDFPRTYHALPTYSEMMFLPRHWGRWTAGAWFKWVDERKVG
jgi:hypothetical protein